MSRKIRDPKSNPERTIPYVVAGAGSYADAARSMHRLQKGLHRKRPPIQTTLPEVKLENFNQLEPGFLRITVDKNEIGFEYFLVPLDDPENVSLFETFTT